MTLDLHFQGNLNMIMALQVKLYKLEDEEHLTWGNTLGRVDFEYELKAGQREMKHLVTTFH